ncbi:MAG: ATP-binding cassette domain-containing protein [Mycoplasmataceae bacterium]|jgi:Fe-S cluster assembly ATP-binding protein|nr:ATP-binding cassette domain-containing protein [Mycoplasmataceae bacterium]
MNFIIKNLSAKIDNVNILNNISLSLKTGDVLAISGLNGSGKTTLLKSIMKHFSLNIKGDINLDKTNFNKLDTYKISKLGVYYVPQHSLELNGVQTLSILRTINKARDNIPFSELFKQTDEFINKMDLPNEILNRNLNVGFSGGQKKKIELLQAQVFNPKVLLIDEIDSGVDTDSLKKIAQYLNSIKKHTIILIISHNNTFLNAIKPTKALVLGKGDMIAYGTPNLLNQIERKGYGQFIKTKAEPRAVCTKHKK